MSDNLNNDSVLIEVTVNELNQCREDDRNSENKIIQAVLIAGTIITLIFGLAHTNEIPMNISSVSLFILNVFVLSIVFCYITAIGIVSVLRYHYIQYLEDRLHLLVENGHFGEENLIHWMSFSSPITTRNPKNVRKYAISHYLSYVFFSVSAIVFCCFITIVSFIGLGNERLRVIGVLVFFIIHTVITIIGAFYYTIYAKKIFDYAMDNSTKNRALRILLKKNIVKTKQNNMEDGDFETHKNLVDKISKRKIIFKNIMRVTCYFIYPKSKDLQKLILVPIGSIAGISLITTYSAIPQWTDFIRNMLITIIVVDVLVYQARYQLNDIRGLKEDMDEGKKRLPADILGPRCAVILSFLFILIKLSVAILLAIKNADMMVPLLVSIALVVVFTILYEIVRAKEKPKLTLFIVTWGYPLRFFAGLFALWPQIRDGIVLSEAFAMWLLLLLVAYLCFGGFTVFLPWVHEAVLEVFINQKNNSDYKVKKTHIRHLFSQIEERYVSSSARMEVGSDSGRVIFSSIRGRGKIRDLWNVSFILSILCLSLLALFISVFSLVSIALEATTVALAIFISFSYRQALNIAAITTIIAKIVISTYLWDYSWFYIFICLNQIIFVTSYLVARYSFDPRISFLRVLSNMLLRLWVLLIGAKTWDFIHDGSAVNYQRDESKAEVHNFYR